MALARIGVGSNLGDALSNVLRAFDALGALGSVVARSGLYRTKAWGVANQPDFVNAAVLLDTPLAPHALLAALKEREAWLGRVASVRWGPRVIDLDILAYDELVLHDPELTLPHPRLLERAFALVPLAEIDPTFGEALARLPPEARAEVRRLDAPALAGIGLVSARSGTAVNWDETLERVRSAAAFCARAGLARFRVEDGEVAIEVRRGPRTVPSSAQAEGAPPTASGELPAPNGAVARDTRLTTLLKAEFVGILRLARPNVVAGTLVTEERELAYVESLGIRNPIRTSAPGRVAQVFVTDGQPIEYGQPLFAIES